MKLVQESQSFDKFSSGRPLPKSRFVLLCVHLVHTDTGMHTHQQAIIPSDSSHCPDLGHCGLRGFEVIDESYPFIHYWRQRWKPRHLGYHRNNPRSADRGKEGRGRKWEGRKVIWARRGKKYRWEVRARTRKCTGNGGGGVWVGGRVHKEQEFFLFYRSTLFSFILAEFRKPEAQSVSCSLLRKDLKIRLQTVLLVAKVLPLSSLINPPVAIINTAITLLSNLKGSMYLNLGLVSNSAGCLVTW